MGTRGNECLATTGMVYHGIARAESKEYGKQN